MSNVTSITHFSDRYDGVTIKRVTGKDDVHPHECLYAVIDRNGQEIERLPTSKLKTFLETLNQRRVHDVTYRGNSILTGCPPSSRLTAAGWITDD